jgi:acetylornithine deacetylase/succinyl-diaminopimelate desuccinylase-like protein
MKNAVAVAVAVARDLVLSGRRPVRDVVFAFTADEEDSAADGAAWLAGEHADLFEGCTEGIGESGAFTFHAAPGVRLYPVGAGERGTAWLTLTARGTAGHGSRPNARNAVTALAAAVTRIGEHQWPIRVTPTVRAALVAIAEALGVEVGRFGVGGVGGAGVAAGGAGSASVDAGGVGGVGVDAGGVGGVGVDAADVEALLARLGPAVKLIAPVLRNSSNPTMLQAGYKINVIPAAATAHVDGRVLPGCEEEFRAALNELTGPDVDWEYYHEEVPLEAPLDAPLVARMTDALLAEDPGSWVVPYCMAGGTDAKHFSQLGIAGYGFTPLALPPGYDYHAMFHGVDERVPVSALQFGVRVMDRLLTDAG